MPIPNFPLNNIDDIYIRKSVELILDFFRRNTPLLDFRHIELSFDTNVTEYPFYHSLGYTPKDVVVTSSEGGSVVFLYSSFDDKKIKLSVTGVSSGTPCKVRFFLGTYNSTP